MKFLRKIEKLNSPFLVKALISFFLILLLFTYFSTQIYKAQLPEVKAKETFSGNLETTIETTGIFKYKNENYVYAPVSGIVDKILVKPGEKVYLETPLISFNAEDLVNRGKEIEKRIKELEIAGNNLEKNENDFLHNSLEKQMLENEIKENEQKINLQNLKKETMERELVNLRKGTDYTLLTDNYIREIKEAEDTYKNKEALYKAGTISKKELEDAELLLYNKRFVYEQFMEKRKDEEEQNDIDIENKQYSYELFLMEIDSSLRYRDELNAKYALISETGAYENTGLKNEINKIDIGMLRQRLDRINRLIEDGGIIRSGYNGIADEMGLEGEVSENSKILTISDNSGEAYIEWYFTEDDINKFKDNIEIIAPITILQDNAQKDDYIEMMVEEKFTGFSKAFDVSKNKYVCGVTVKEGKYMLGMAQNERLNIEITSVSKKYDYIIPKSAITFTSKNKGLVFLLFSRKEVYGNEYYVIETPVSVRAYDDINAAVTENFDGGKVVYETNKTLRDDIAVKVREEP